MEFFKHNTQINFMAQRKVAAVISLCLFLLSLMALWVNGLNWGLDFTGGTQLQLHYEKHADIPEIQSSLQQAGFHDATVVSFGTSQDVLVTVVSKGSLRNSEGLTKQISKVLPNAHIEQVNVVGPQVGQEMTTRGLFAVIIALLGTMVYIGFRFDRRFAIGSTVALVHDPILILGVFAFLKVEFNLISLAAVLTVIGYSLNDTIVIFDRVRENFRKLRKADAVTVMNQSINQTLSRTIMTSALTLTVVLALFFLGGSSLHGFSLALIIGIVVGTYSSIYVAGSLSIWLGLDREHLVPPLKVVDQSP